jgi:hypothetical protein
VSNAVKSSAWLLLKPSHSRRIRLVELCEAAVSNISVLKFCKMRLTKELSLLKEENGIKVALLDFPVLLLEGRHLGPSRLWNLQRLQQSH